MHLQKNHLAGIAVIMTCCCWAAQAAQKPYPDSYRDGSCPNGVDCIPKRGTYGYTETKWRKWPTAEKPAAAKSEPENLPTPAKELPKVEPEGPQLPSEEIPLVPTEMETEPAMPETPGVSPQEPPFEDTPPEPPMESPRQSEPPKGVSEPAGGLPSAAPQIQPPAPKGSDKAPPTEDEDPFKDDPIPGNEAPAASPPSSGAAKSNPAKNSHQAGDPRRVDNKGALTVADSSQTSLAAASDEPHLLRVNAEPEDARGTLPINVASVRNPLRSETAKPRGNKVVPAAGWSADQGAGSDEPGLMRVAGEREGAHGMLPINTPSVRNPLRSEIAQRQNNKVVPTADGSADQARSSDSAGTWRRNPLRTN